MTDTTNATIGEAAQDYARHLSVAVLKAGACGRVHVQSPGSVTTASAQHEQWPSLRLHLCRQEVAIYCVPTSDGVVLVIAAAGHPSRYLPTWGARAGLRRPRIHDRPRPGFAPLTLLFILVALLEGEI